jgi:(2Fe-2S) ferredoxin
MGKSQNSRVAFRLEGRFLGYEIEDGAKIKRFKLATATGEQVIKLSRQARATLNPTLALGEWIVVVGEQKIDRATATSKWKAHDLQPVTTPPQSPTPPVAKILFCQKSDCQKRGGKAMCRALEQAIADRHLTDRVTLQGTGCMKDCHQGPNLIMPGKNRYRRVAAQDIPALVDEYFPPEAVPLAEKECAKALVVYGATLDPMATVMG